MEFEGIFLFTRQRSIQKMLYKAHIITTPDAGSFFRKEVLFFHREKMPQTNDVDSTTAMNGIAIS
eukprot:scaffold108877_cov45-Attheya_sp.AAC.3